MFPWLVCHPVKSITALRVWQDVDAEQLQVTPINKDVMFSTCEKGDPLDGNPLEGDFCNQSSDHFVQLGNQGNLLEGVCKPVLVSTLSNTTNTVTSASNILTQVTDLKIVDAENCQNIPTNCLQIPATSVTSNTDIATNSHAANVIIPVQTITNTSNTEQMYVMAMTFDDETMGTDNTIKEDVGRSLLFLETDLNLAPGTNATSNKINDLKEPQRTSTPTFDENCIGNFNDTIIGGHNLQNMVLTTTNLVGSTCPEPGVSPIGHAEVSAQEASPVGCTEEKSPVGQPDVSAKASPVGRTEEKSPVGQPDVSAKASPVGRTQEPEASPVSRREKHAASPVSQKKETPIGRKRNEENCKIEESKENCFKKAKECKNYHNDNYNDKYCKEWVRKCQTFGSDQIAQSDASTCVEQDSCNSSLLDNVTSVSHTREKQKPTQFVKPKNNSQVGKKLNSEKDKDMWVHVNKLHTDLSTNF